MIRLFERHCARWTRFANIYWNAYSYRSDNAEALPYDGALCFSGCGTAVKCIFPAALVVDNDKNRLWWCEVCTKCRDEFTGSLDLIEAYDTFHVRSVDYSSYHLANRLRILSIYLVYAESSKLTQPEQDSCHWCLRYYPIQDTVDYVIDGRQYPMTYCECCRKKIAFASSCITNVLVRRMGYYMWALEGLALPKDIMWCLGRAIEEVVADDRAFIGAADCLF